MPADEAALIRSALEGSQAAYARLMSLHKLRVYNLILTMVGNQEDAADLTQETFIKAFRSLGGFNPGSSFRSWITTIASNTCIDFFRKARPETVSAEEVEIAEPSAGPGEEFIRKRRRIRIEEAIQALPENLRAAIILRHKEDLSYQEIAEILGVPMGTVKTWIKRGREILRSRLKR
ncbi:MAG: RNA polymerase sigma factor [bacterium]